MATLHSSHFQVNPATSTSYVHNLVFIDMAVEDYSGLVNGVLDNSQVFVLDSAQNGVEEITAILASYNRTNLTNIHIVCHGAPGYLQLGNTHLGLDTLDEYSQQLQQWQKIFSASAKSNNPWNLLIYGCNVALGDAGTEFIDKLHQLTGANIAASRQRIGNAALGGDWELEVRTADMEVSLVFAETTRQAYAGVLATFTVNSTGDKDDGDPKNGITTLREAINLANTTAGDDTIAFGGVFTDATPDTITLTSGQLSITDDITILGTGASQLTVSGNNASRVFEISGIGKDVSIDGLAIVNGKTDIWGGGIRINANTILSLTNSIVSGNTSNNLGGGIYNGLGGNLSLTNSIVSDNTANYSGGGISNQGNFTLINSTVSGNIASSGGGITNSDPNGNDNVILSITNSTVSGNTADYGGGISNESILMLTNSTVSGNTANYDGGGIYSGTYFYGTRLGTGILTNSTISGNTSLLDGGGIYNYNILSLINSTITNNA